MHRNCFKQFSNFLKLLDLSFMYGGRLLKLLIPIYTTYIYQHYFIYCWSHLTLAKTRLRFPDVDADILKHVGVNIINKYVVHLLVWIKKI
jgi:hypothetical protein